MWVEIVGGAAFIATAIAIAPQAWRVIRTGQTAGVSADWALLGAISTAVWTIYTGIRGLWWATIADAMASASYTVTLIALVRRSVEPRWIAGGLWAAVFVLAALVGGADAVGAALSFAFAVQIAPSVVLALRSDDHAGVSRSTWGLVSVEGALWMTYGAAKGDAAVIAFGTIALGAGITILLIVATHRHTLRSTPRETTHRTSATQPTESQPGTGQ